MTTDKTIKQRILNYLEKRGEWIREAELVEASVRAGLSGSTVSRTARKMAEDEEIQRDHYKGSNGQEMTKYAILKVEKPKPKKLVEITNSEGQRVMVYQ